MNKRVIRVLVLVMLLILNVTMISNLNIVTAKASTEVSVENTEKKSFFERLKEKSEQRKKEKEKKKQEKELNKNIKKAKKNLNKKKYDQVLEILNPELDKDIDVSEAELLCNMVKYYIGAGEDFENKMYEAAREKLTAIDGSYEEYKIKEDIDQLRAKVENKLAYKEEINTKIDKAAILIDEKELQSAKSQIKELLNKDIDDEQKSRLTELDGNVDLMIEEEKKAEAERKRAEELKKQQEAANKQINNNSSSSNNSSNSGTTGGTYYIASGNRYYHKTPSCKFIKGASATATSNISGKFACNCVKY